MAQGKQHEVPSPSHPVSPWGSRGVCGIVSRFPLSTEWWVGRACEQVVDPQRSCQSSWLAGSARGATPARHGLGTEGGECNPALER